ncbi:MAG: TolC family protein, partial [Deltaproteobacteria bacterium]|nr:TolC family protein [Deltaproteobacteria bacterium]
MNRSFFCLLAVLAILLVTGGCMKMGPDYHRPDTGIQVPASYEYGSEQREAPQLEDRWWEVFGDPELNQLVDDVLANNLDIKKATAAILEVRAQLVQTRADRFPSVSVQGGVERQHRPEGVAVPGQPVTFDRESTTYDVSLPASFEIDLWGRLARAEEAARAGLLQAEENRLTVAQTVVAETIILYLRMESIERGIQITNHLTDTLRRSLILVQSRYERGLTSVLDVRQARRTLARAEAILPSLRQDLGITQQQLAVLLGRYP